MLGHICTVEFVYSLFLPLSPPLSPPPPPSSTLRRIVISCLPQVGSIIVHVCVHVCVSVSVFPLTKIGKMRKNREREREKENNIRWGRVFLHVPSQVAGQRMHRGDWHSLQPSLCFPHTHTHTGTLTDTQNTHVISLSSVPSVYLSL